MDDEIKICLNCEKEKCNNCLSRKAVNQKKFAQYDYKTGKLIAIYNSKSDAAKAVSGVEKRISECCRVVLKRYKGFKWATVQDELEQNVSS